MSCRVRLPKPELAGYCDTVDPKTGEVLVLAMDRLKDAAAQYPHLRPCHKEKMPGGDWAWVEKKGCVKCMDYVEEE